MPQRVDFSFDGAPLTGWAGDNLAAALMQAGERRLRDSPRAGQPRGAFCLMGSCQECVVWVDGTRREACRTTLRAGMAIRSGTIADAAI
jgi:predicted molibdopterin-dependent oxidoreductase YjgC